jgi:hypothetical protein
MVYVLEYWKNCTKLAFLTSDSNYKETKITFNVYDNMHKMISSKILEGMKSWETKYYITGIYKLLTGRLSTILLVYINF